MTRPSDTSHEAWRLQMAAFRRMTPQERLAIGMAMSDEVRALAEAGVRARHPEYSDAEVARETATIMLGEPHGSFSTRSRS